MTSSTTSRPEKYPRIIEAALSETASKFKLAEALATEIPAKKEGDGQKVMEQLEAALQEIENNGGEEVSAHTLSHYRRVGLWVLTPEVNSRGFTERRSRHTVWRWICTSRGKN